MEDEESFVIFGARVFRFSVLILWKKEVLWRERVAFSDDCFVQSLSKCVITFESTRSLFGGRKKERKTVDV